MDEKKPILLTIGDVRIRREDKMNVGIERFETYHNPLKKEDTSGWRFKGYASTVLAALRLIIERELLLEDVGMDLKGYVERVEASNERAIKEVSKIVSEAEF